MGRIGSPRRFALYAAIALLGCESPQAPPVPPAARAGVSPPELAGPAALTVDSDPSQTDSVRLAAGEIVLDDCPAEVSVPPDFALELAQRPRGGSTPEVETTITAHGAVAGERRRHVHGGTPWSRRGWLTRHTRYRADLDRHAMSRVLCAVHRSGVWTREPGPSDCHVPADAGTGTRVITIRSNGRERRLEIPPGFCAERNQVLLAFVTTVQRASGWSELARPGVEVAESWAADPSCFHSIDDDFELSFRLKAGPDLEVDGADVRLSVDVPVLVEECMIDRARSGDSLGDLGAVLSERGVRLRFAEVTIRAASYRDRP